jgi:hypothetical protein
MRVRRAAFPNVPRCTQCNVECRPPGTITPVAPEHASEHPCTTCGYPRTGLPTATPCPECGTPSPLARREISGGERRAFSWGYVLAILGPCTLVWLALGRLDVPLMRESFCAMQPVVLLGAFLLAHRKARQEVPATWRLEESGLLVTLPGKTLTLPWSAIRACHVERSIEGYVGMTLEG